MRGGLVALVAASLIFGSARADEFLAPYAGPVEPRLKARDTAYTRVVRQRFVTLDVAKLVLRTREALDPARPPVRLDVFPGTVIVFRPIVVYRYKDGSAQFIAMTPDRDVVNATLGPDLVSLAYTRHGIGAGHRTRITIASIRHGVQRVVDRTWRLIPDLSGEDDTDWDDDDPDRDNDAIRARLTRGRSAAESATARGGSSLIGMETPPRPPFGAPEATTR